MTGRRLPRSRNAYTLVEALVVIAIIGVLVGLTTAGVQKVRARAAATQCQNNLRQIGLGMTNYHNAHGQLPTGSVHKPQPNTFPWMGWGAQLLPEIEQNAVWQQTLAAIRAEPNNFHLSPPHPFTTVIPTYGCPADGRMGRVVLARGTLPVALGSYLGVAGTRNVRRDGVLYTDSSVKFTDITDGVSNTLLVGERPPSPDMWTGWWYAGVGVDFRGTADTVLGVQERATAHREGFPDCGSGTAKYQNGQLGNICDIMHFWSLHPGGGHFLFADGSVHFLTYSAADLMPALATRAGGESVTFRE